MQVSASGGGGEVEGEEQEERGMGLDRNIPWPQVSLICRRGAQAGRVRELNLLHRV